jgi:hypothetical protein
MKGFSRTMLGGLVTSALVAAIIVVPPPMPTDVDQCKQGGWEQYGVFKNQGDCVSYVVTEGRNPPALGSL